jgi:hypothetical protein
MPRRIERQDEIDHRQTRAYQKRTSAGFDEIADGGLRLRPPWIADVAGAAAFKCSKRRRLLIADCKNKRFGRYGLAIVE